MFEGNDISVLRDLWLPFLEHLFKTEICFSMNQLGVIGLEMEGSYYQKAIQSASKIKSVPHDVKVRYAYYASDNPLETKHISFRRTGNNVKPTYLITIKILNRFLT
jgi:hypothetical protein